MKKNTVKFVAIAAIALLAVGGGAWYFLAPAKPAAVAGEKGKA